MVNAIPSTVCQVSFSVWKINPTITLNSGDVKAIGMTCVIELAPLSAM